MWSGYLSLEGVETTGDTIYRVRTLYATCSITCNKAISSLLSTQMCFINSNCIPTFQSHPKSFDHTPTLVTITSRKKMKTHLCAIKGCTTCNEGPCVTVCHSSDILPTWEMLPIGNMGEVSWFWVIRMSCKVQL